MISSQPSEKKENLSQMREDAKQLLVKLFASLNQKDEYKDQIVNLDIRNTGKLLACMDRSANWVVFDEKAVNADAGPTFIYYSTKGAKVNNFILDFFCGIQRPTMPKFRSTSETTVAVGYCIENKNLGQLIKKLEITLGIESKPEAASSPKSKV